MMNFDGTRRFFWSKNGAYLKKCTSTPPCSTSYEPPLSLFVRADLPLELAGRVVPLGAILEVAAGVVDPGQGGVVLPPAPELRWCG